MTRKDAIDRLDIIVSKHEVDDVYITLTNEKDYKALKVAINSLRIDERYELEYEQAEPKTGHWITKIKSDLRGDMWPTNPKCSECGGEPYYNDTIYNYHFCPYCGARMAESEDKE